jgi:hypothetical protein
MSIAIDTTSTTSSASAGTSQSNSGAGSSAVLQAQLDRCTKQLGDWVNCSSGKTPEGKQIIQALQEKISTIKAQIQTRQTRIEQSASQTRSTVATSSDVVSANGATNGAVPISPALAAIGSIGTLLNAIA